jgi:catechol 1,2-dioxygenase
MSLEVSPETLAVGRRGQPLTVSGAVLNRSCRPIAGASIEAWQVDADGEYGPGHGTDAMRCCYLTGRVRTDANGRYQLDTIMPGHYKGAGSAPPAHIHIGVSHPGDGQVLTELHFAGDPALSANAHEDNVVPVVRDPAGWRARFDIVLSNP